MAEMTAVKKFINHSGHFEDRMIFKWQSMESSENRIFPCICITVCDNPRKCILNTVELTHI